METTSDRHRQHVSDVEGALHRVAGEWMQGALLEGCLQLWYDFAIHTDLSRSRKPEAWAAALLYAFDRLQFGGLSQEEAAARYQVSAITVSQKYRQMAQVLDLKLLDARYLPEARRTAVRREYGNLPEGIPLLEAPTGFWHLPFDLRTHDPLHEAQERVYEGWELLGEDSLGQAERCFREALRIDPMLADAHNGLAGIAGARDDLAAAEAHYRTAYELARDALGSESPQAYHWWGELETRPYMRARLGLGWTCWQTGRYREALEEYETLLRLNPNDNQGARYLIGPLYQLAGDLQGALAAYKRYEKAYRGDWGDPHHTLSWGQALYAGGRREEALRRWRQAIFQNIYLVPVLLAEALPGTDLWHATNLGEPGYAEDYGDLYGTLWRHETGAREALRRLWHDAEVAADVARWVEIGRALQGLTTAVRRQAPEAQKEWRRLVEEQRRIEGRAPSEATMRRVLIQEG